jgi:type IV pilus assembly protein PilO
MAILPTTQRDRGFAVVGLIAVLAAAAFYMLRWDPARVELNATEARIDTLQQLNERAKTEVARGKTNDLKAEAERYAQDLQVMRRLVPLGNEVPALLDQVSSAARKVGLEVSDVQPMPSMSGDQYDAFKYRIKVRGSYHQIGTFLTSIGSLQRIVAPVNLSLDPQAPGAGAAKTNRLQPLEARFEIQTYVARATPPPPSKSTSGKANEPPKPGEKE